MKGDNQPGTKFSRFQKKLAEKMAEQGIEIEFTKEAMRIINQDGQLEKDQFIHEEDEINKDEYGHLEELLMKTQQETSNDSSEDPLGYVEEKPTPITEEALKEAGYLNTHVMYGRKWCKILYEHPRKAMTVRTSNSGGYITEVAGVLLTLTTIQQITKIEELIKELT